MEEHHRHDRAAVSNRTMELVVAAIVFAFGAVVVYDSARLGAEWADDGPQAGYFPFYIGLLTCLAAVIVFAKAAFDARGRKAFVGVGQLAMVLKLFVPTVVFVALIQVVGLYFASTLFIAFFMIWLGKYAWIKAVPVAVAVNLSLFLLFEVWFKVPLPKGPIEAAFGLH
ncbi:MAG: tripartite tricarboxylate transporter TctB family protein [Burkholderiales bacterium]|nr:tripartite tricarboxylate transporter TctB family protein [Burkholderiales bacterium]